MIRNKKYKGFVNLGLPIKKSLKFLNKRYNPALLILNKNWSEIIGEKYYKYCKPEKLYFKKNSKNNGVLYLVVYNPVLSMYIDSNKKYILDKMNTFFGYQAIRDIKIRQSPKLIEEYCKKKKGRIINKKEEKQILSVINKNINKNLKKELEDLGKNILKYKNSEN